MSIEVGHQAPDFTLPLCDGENVGTFTLSEHLGRGPLVLAFFPLAFTPVCTDELCQLSSEFDKFSQMNAQVYGISVDSPFTLNAFINANRLKIKLLSDFNKDVSAKYAVLHEELKGLRGVAKRSVFVLDREGVVRYKWVSEDPSVLPNFAEIEGALQQIAD